MDEKKYDFCPLLNKEVKSLANFCSTRNIKHFGMCNYWVGGVVTFEVLKAIQLYVLPMIIFLQQHTPLCLIPYVATSYGKCFKMNTVKV